MADHDFAQIVAHQAGYFSYHAEIDKDDLKRPCARRSFPRFFGQYKKIARMGIGVKKALFKYLLEVGVQHDFGHFFRIDAVIDQRGDIGHLQCLNIFQDEDAFGRISR